MARNYRIALVLISILFAMSLVGYVQPTVGQSASEEFQQTYDVDAGTELKVENINGDITVEAWNNDDVEVYAEKVTQLGQSELDKVSIEVTTGNVMTVKTAYTGQIPDVTVNYRIRVPSDVTVKHLKTVNGDISLEGTNGDTTLVNTNGDISVKDADGSIKATTTNGDVIIDDVTGIRGVQTTTGKIEVEIPSLSSNVQIKTTNGAITAYIAENLNADILMETTNGQVTVHDLQLTLTTSTATRVEGTMGNGGYDLTITNTNGNIDLYKLDGGVSADGEGLCLGTLLISMFSITALVAYALVRYRKIKLI